MNQYGIGTIVCPTNQGHLDELMNTNGVIVLNEWTERKYEKSGLRDGRTMTLTDMKEANTMFAGIKGQGIPAALVKFPEGWGYHADLFIAECPLCTDSDAPVCNETVCDECKNDTTNA